MTAVIAAHPALGNFRDAFFHPQHPMVGEHVGVGRQFQSPSSKAAL